MLRQLSVIGVTGHVLPPFKNAECADVSAMLHATCVHEACRCISFF